MKRIILALIAAMTLCSLVQAKNRTVTENDSLGNKKRVIELRDTTIDGKTVTDTLSIMTYEGSSSDSKSDKGWKHHNSSGWDWDFDLDGKTSETIISVTAIVFIFGLPLLIVFTVFFFNYKNRKAKYRLAEQALSSGQQLPEDFFKNAEKTEDIRTKGIKNIFIGIGLFIFLWAITENFGVGCVGLLVTRCLTKKYTPENIHEIMAEHYLGQHFVKVMELGGTETLPDGFIAANTLAGTNNMQIFVCGNEDQILLMSRFDNLGKGASGAAIQNMNIMLGINEATGLE